MVENKIEFPNMEETASDDECVWAMVCHLSCLFGGIIVPIVIFKLKGKSSSYISFHARQAMSYQGSVLLLLLLTFGIVLPLAPLFVLMGVIWSVRARNGEKIGYPILRRFVS